MKNFRIGILREEKAPIDKRVPLTPNICVELINRYPNVEIIIQPSNVRCYSNEEYSEVGFSIEEDLSTCDLLMGVKEVPSELLIPEKKYFFFSHTVKKQPHNKKLMQAMLKKKIQMIDYEMLTDGSKNRIVSFGRYAGIVGAYNGILGYGKKYGLFSLKPANICRDRVEMESELKRVALPNLKIALTGGGRVANGAIETLSTLKLRRVTPDEFLRISFHEPVYCQLNPRDYVERKEDGNFDLHDFFNRPDRFVSTFPQYTRAADIYISAHYWDPRAPKMFEISDVKAPGFKLSVVADITCDVPGSVPTTIRPTSIEDPFYGYNLYKDREDSPFCSESMCVMAVENLPSELPRDASEGFGVDLLEHVLPSAISEDPDGIIERASICQDGYLNPSFQYLSEYAY